MPANGPTPEEETRAQELYWTSDLSVNQIAEKLDLSKGMLYGMVEPLDAGVTCPSCGSGLVWPNRTARTKGLAACPDCDWEGAIEDAGTPSAGTTGRGRGRAALASARRVADYRTRSVLGGALLGAAAGLAMILWVRRR